MPKSQFSSLAMSLSIDHQAQWCQGAWTWTCAPTLTTWNIGMVGDLQAGHEKLNPQGYEEPIYWSLRFFQVDFWPSYWPCFHWDWDQHGNFTIQLQYDNWQNCSIRWRIPYTVSLFSCWWNHCILIYVYLSLFCQYFRTSKLSEFTSNLVKMASPSIEETSWITIA